jgi:hypothetical protein
MLVCEPDGYAPAAVRVIKVMIGEQQRLSQKRLAGAPRKASMHILDWARDHRHELRQVLAILSDRRGPLTLAFRRRPLRPMAFGKLRRAIVRRLAGAQDIVLRQSQVFE